MEVDATDVSSAIKDSIEDVQQSVRNAYYEAIFSVHSDTIYAQVLAACAMAKSNDLGWFPASSVRDPLSRIMNKKYDIQSFARHLGAFCDVKRGQVLQKEGRHHSYKYRFSNPLMQPFAIIKVLAEDQVKGEIDNLLGS